MRDFKIAPSNQKAALPEPQGQEKISFVSESTIDFAVKKNPAVSESVMVIGNVDPKCPYCDFLFAKKPNRQRKCPNCKKTIFVRTVGNGARALLTEDQLNQYTEHCKRLIEQRERKRQEERESDPEYKSMESELAEKWRKQPSVDDIEWGLLNRQLIDHARNGDWGLYRNTKLEMARVLWRKRGEFEKALKIYLEICYLDINGPNNTGGVSVELLREFPPFDPKQGFILPGIVEDVEDMIEGLEMPLNQIKGIFFEIATSNFNNLKLPITPDKAWEELQRALDFIDESK